jgi:predicted nucleic-acid-binding protein
MISVDTNIVVRIIVQDDANQTDLAQRFCARGVIVPLTVSMEVEWVLRSRYLMTRAAIIDSFSVLIEAADFHFEESEKIGWLLERYSQGADFADLIHIVASCASDGFATFDKGLALGAGLNTPIPIETI